MRERLAEGREPSAQHHRALGGAACSCGGRGRISANRRERGNCKGRQERRQAVRGEFTSTLHQ